MYGCRWGALGRLREATAFEPIFQANGVNLYFSGHVHAYESIWPVSNSTDIWPDFIAPPYTTYVVSGAAGNVESHTDMAGDATPRWSRVSNNKDFGISTLAITNATSLTFTFRRATDGAALDSWTLTRAD